MLSFTRRLTESFIIGEEIVVKVLGYDAKGNVRFGIDAPKSISIHREEVYKKLNKSIKQQISFNSVHKRTHT